MEFMADQDIKEAFGNSAWAADDRYRNMMLHYARTADNVLECGSGLTSLDLARAGVSGIALENLLDWFGYVEGVAAGMKVEWFDFKVLYAPLIDFGLYEWYNFETTRMYDFVVCDGPRRSTTKGARYGLLPRMIDNLAPGARILFDDFDESVPEEMDALGTTVISAWQNLFGITVEKVYGDKPRRFALLQMPWRTYRRKNVKTT